MTDWTLLDKATIFTAKDEDGNRYLSEFMRDYMKMFPNTDPQAGCSKCLDEYYNNFIKKYKEMNNQVENTTGYKLKEKYQNIPLEFGSGVLVNNQNITEEFAIKLLERENGENLFETLPEAKTAVVKDEVIEDNKEVVEVEKVAEKAPKQAKRPMKKK